MQLQPITSSNIESVGYDRPTRTLAVKFKGGSTYHYHGVPESVHASLVAAPSAGAHFAQHIKGKFTYTKRKES